MAPHAGQEGAVAGFAVAENQPRENADDAGLVEGGQGGVVGHELFAVDCGPQGEVVVQHGRFQFGGHVAAGVLEQGVQVPGRVGQNAVLEVDHADAGGARAVRQPEQIFGVVIAVGEDSGSLRGAAAEGSPEFVPFGGVIGADGNARFEFRQPLDEEVGAGLQGQVVVGEQGPGCARRFEDGGRDGVLQDGEGLDGGAVEGGLIVAGLDAADEQAIAEVF